MREAGKWSQPHSLCYWSISKTNMGQNWEFSSYTQWHFNDWIVAFFFFNNVIGELFICFILHQNLKGLSVCAISFSFEPSISQAFAHTVLQNLLLSRHKWLPNSHKSRGLLSVLILFDPKPMYDISPFFFVHLFVHLNWLQEHNSFKKFIYFNWRLNTVKYCVFFCIHGHESAIGARVPHHHKLPSHLPPHPIPLDCPCALFHA